MEIGKSIVILKKYKYLNSFKKLKINDLYCIIINIMLSKQVAEHWSLSHT